jgi:hypothetical protein
MARSSSAGNTLRHNRWSIRYTLDDRGAGGYREPSPRNRNFWSTPFMHYIGYPWSQDWRDRFSRCRLRSDQGMIRDNGRAAAPVKMMKEPRGCSLTLASACRSTRRSFARSLCGLSKANQAVPRILTCLHGVKGPTSVIETKRRALCDLIELRSLKPLDMETIARACPRP